jgi:hypothetical protein
VTLRIVIARGLVAPVAVLLVSACSPWSDEEFETFAGNGVSLRYPSGWHVSGFSETNSPQRLAVASFELPAAAVEGDCGGAAAVAKLPRGGALVLLFDYGSFPRALPAFPPRPATFTLGRGAFANYECFGPGRRFRFRTRGRNFHAHVAFGGSSSGEVRGQALAILDSLTVESQMD